MYQTSIYPLRTCVGRAIPVGKPGNIRLIGQSPQSGREEIKYDFAVKSRIAETESHPGDGTPAHPGYRDYLPVYEAGGGDIFGR